MISVFKHGGRLKVDRKDEQKGFEIHSVLRMENSFEVLEWESVSKEQDLLVRKLFGDISSSKEPGEETTIRMCDHERNENLNGLSISKGKKRTAVRKDECKLKNKTKRQVRNKSVEQDDTSIVNINLKPSEPPFEHESTSPEEEAKGNKRRQKRKKKRKEVIDQERNDESTLPHSFQSLEQQEAGSGNIGWEPSQETEHVNSVEDRIIIENNLFRQRKKPRYTEGVDLSCHTSSRTKPNLQEKMRKRLESSRFRWINEQLYTRTGNEALKMFSQDPNLYDIYHRGFTNQVKLWPVNPVNLIIDWLKHRPPSLVVVDFGCGEAVIARSISNKVHSFDLVAKNELVTACDMSKVPLSSESADVAVFCLSLMGTNLVEYLKEAHRVLKLGGILKIAEVASRISDNAEFSNSLSRLGFKLQMEDSTNRIFVLFDFIKAKESVRAIPSNKLEGLNLKPCIYKKR